MTTAPALFASSRVHARALGPDGLPTLQALFDANPDYFVIVTGKPARADEAQREFDEQPPAHLPHGHLFFLGLHDEHGTLIGITIVLSDFVVPGVWHVALYFVASHLHGLGMAAEAFAALQAWAQQQGARWLRLGVVETNLRARRFWARQGFEQVRTREVTNDDGRVNQVLVMIKCLAPDATLGDYLVQVPRDQPGSSLP